MSEELAVHSAEREILTPSQLTRRARDVLEDRFGLIWLEGEISNFSRPASGHLYFSLKDGGAQVRCAMFKPKSTWLRFKPADGMQVLARARVSLYEARGEFQLIVEHLEEAGEGALRREFERLKAKLAALGLFEPAHKRTLPRFPRRIGIITSPSGAAVRDVVSVIARRFPLVKLDIIPVPVQGKEAPPAIVAAINAAGSAGLHDVLLLTRGGGSIEDLWAFNDESVAHAIHASPLAIVSAIGHEIDFTIADFVADLRAATPSAAAELLVPDARELSLSLTQRKSRLHLLIQRMLQAQAQRLDRLLARLEARNPQVRLALGRSRLDGLSRRLQHARIQHHHRQALRLNERRERLARQHPALRLERARNAARDNFHNLQRSINQLTNRHRATLAELARALHAISPLRVLERGYAVLLDDSSGRVVRSIDDTDSGATVRAKLHDGELRLRVE